MSSAHPTFREALRFWLKLGFISFGGPAGQIAIMQTELVDRKRWIGQERFLHALNFCMLLPGPEAQQLAIYCGWLLHRTWGGIVAGVLFVLPSALILWGLSVLYVTYGTLPWVAGVFHGLKPAIVAVVIAAVVRIGRRALKNEVLWVIAAIAFVLIFFARVPFPAIVFGALIIGYLGGRYAPDKFAVSDAHSPAGSTVATGAPSAPGFVVDDLAAAGGVRPTWRRAGCVVAVCGGLWLAPLAVLLALDGGEGRTTLLTEGLFFSKAAMVTFGGAYAVLPYVAQQAVGRYAWLQAPQMVDGLAFAETTPGPLIMVLQFVGFMGAWNHPGGLPPLLAATLGAALTTWVTFVPCFLWIFLGAPHIERLRGSRRLAAALSAVTASVVGVILNLAVWFGWHVALPRGAAVDWFAVGLTVAAFAALHGFKVGLFPVIAVCGVLGVLWGL